MKLKIPFKRLLTLFLVFPIFISLFIGFLPNNNRVFALPGNMPASLNGGIGIGVILSGTSNPRSYNVSGSRTVSGTTTNYSFSYKTVSGTAAFYMNSPYVQAAGGNCTGPGGSSATARNEIQIVATQGSNRWSSNISLCGDEVNFIIFAGLRVSGSGQSTGTVSGSIHYKDQNNTTQPFQSSAQGVLTGPGNQSYPLVFDNNGNFTPIHNLPPGSYTITANYNSPNPADALVKTYTKTFNLGSGQNYVVSGSVACTASGGCAAPNNLNSKASPTCESSGFSLSWIMCPIINGMASAVDGIYSLFIQPLLVSPPVQLNSSDPLYKAWSNFRLYADILLLIGLLVVVYGEALGGGVLDAYNARKMLPRILLAAILINLSIYIVAASVDITNIIGTGIGSLIEAPFKTAHAFTLTLNGGTSAIGLTGIGLSGLITGGAIFGVAAGVISIGPFIQFFLVFILLPTLLTFIAILVTVLIRRGIILLLVITSPIAFALYCLPNTEKYFKKWWELFFKTLLVYPIIAVVFAVANVLSVTINKSGQTSGLVATLTGLMSIIALIVPLFMIPFSFRIAGGIMGTMHKTFSDFRNKGLQVIKGNPNDPRSFGNKTRYGAKSQINSARGRAYDSLSSKTKSSSSANRPIRRRLFSSAAGILNYGNLQAERANMNKEQEEIASSQYSMGDDGTFRALWATQYNGEDEPGQDGRKKGFWYSPYQNADGSYKEWSVSDVKKARSLMARDPSKFNAWGKYELSKAAHEGQVQTFQQRFIELAQENHWNANDANKVWAGIKFAHQTTRKELKYQNIKQNNGRLEWGNIDHPSFSNELVDTMTNGNFSGFRDTTAKAATQGFNEVKQKLDLAGGNLDSLSPQDRKTYDNYQLLSNHLNNSIQRDPNAIARNALAAAQNDPAEANSSSGYFLGASARATEAWKDFLRATGKNVT